MARRIVVILIGLAAAGVFASHGLSAHGSLLISDPLDGSTLGDAPDAIRLTFSEAPEPSLSEIRVTDSQGISYQTGRPGLVAGDPLSLAVGVARLDRGVYVVTWRIVSAVDGHATSGMYTFGVRADPSALRSTASSSAEISGLEVIARSAFLAGIILLVGATAAALARFGGGTELPLAWSGLVAAATGVVLLFVAQRRGAAAPLQALLGTFVGRALLWRAAALAVSAVGLVAASTRPPRRRHAAMAVAAAAALACAGVHVAAGHDAAPGLFPPIATIIGQWTHVVAAAIWFGGLAALLLGTRGAPSEAKAASVRRFSTIAAIALVIVLVSGVGRAVGELASWRDLIGTTYGGALSIKVLLTAAIAGLGAVNRRSSVPSAPVSLWLLRRVGGGELLLAAAALVVAAVLTTAPPPAAAARSPVGLSASAADYGTTVRVRLTAASDQPGPNRFKVQIADYDSKAPVEATRVSLRFASLEDPTADRTPLPLTSTAGGSYVGSGANLAFGGRWRISVLIERGEGSVEVPLDVETRRVAQPVSIARFPGQPPMYTVEVKRAGFVRISPVPEREGDSKLYVTCYDVLQDERPVVSIVVGAESTDGQLRQLPVQRLTASRFVADAKLVRGHNRIVVVARLHDGSRMRAALDLEAPQQ